MAWPLADAFQLIVDFRANDGSIRRCPGGLSSPGTWHYPATPDMTAGQIMCAQYYGAEMTWTRDSDLPF